MLCGLWGGGNGQVGAFLCVRSSFFHFARFLNFNGDDPIVSVSLRIWLWLVSGRTERLSVCEFKAQQHALPKVARVLFIYVMHGGVRNFESRIILDLCKVCYDLLRCPILIPTLKQLETFHTLKIHSFKH